MNTEDQEEIPEECTKAAAELMNQFVKLTGIDLTASCEVPAFVEQLRTENQLREKQIEQQNQALETEDACNKAMLAEAQAWHKTIQAVDGMNSVEDGIHWVRICTPDGSNCFDTVAFVENNRLMVYSDDECRNRSREIVNGRFIIDVATFTGTTPAFYNLFGFLLFECELPHPQ
jgi:hypothetical protein